MVDLKKDFGTDKDKEIEGVWFDSEFEGDTKCLIARVNNPNYMKVFNRLSKPHRRALRKQTISEEISEVIMLKTMAETILLDWKNLKEGDVEVPYTKENAYRVLKEYRDFRDIVADLANDIEGFRIEMEEEAEKNLETS